MEEILAFFSQNKDALTAIGIILTFLVSISSLYFTMRNNKAVHYVNSITKSRIEWIQKLRKTIAEFVAKTNIYNNAYYRGDFDKSGEQLSECQALCTEIKLLLNCFDEKDRKICRILDDILDGHRQYVDAIHNLQVDDEGYFIESKEIKVLKDKVEQNIELLMKEMHIYLKVEWDRVKYESQGKTYEKGIQIFDLLEYEKKFDNIKYKNRVYRRQIINLIAKIKRFINSYGIIICLLGLIIIIYVLKNFR